MNFERTTAPICLKQFTFASLLVILLLSNGLTCQRFVTRLLVGTLSKTVSPAQ